MLQDINDVYDKNEDNVSEEQEVIIENNPNTCEEEREEYDTTYYNTNETVRPHDQPKQQYSMVMGDKPVSFFERMVDLIFKHGIFKSIGAFLLIMACVMLWQFINALNYDKITEKILTEMVERDNQAKTDNQAAQTLRLENNGKIQKVLVRLLYETGADRASILEMHNGKENPSLLPFVYCDMTYEETKGKVAFVADEYEQLNMGKYPFFSHIIEERVIFSSVQDILKYDKKFYNKLVLNDTKYIAMLVIKNEVDIGFLVVSYVNEPTIDKHKLLIQLTDCAQELGVLLDLAQPEQTK